LVVANGETVPLFSCVVPEDRSGAAVFFGLVAQNDDLRFGAQFDHLVASEPAFLLAEIQPGLAVPVDVLGAKPHHFAHSQLRKVHQPQDVPYRLVADQGYGVIDFSVCGQPAGLSLSGRGFSGPQIRHQGDQVKLLPGNESLQSHPAERSAGCFRVLVDGVPREGLSRTDLFPAGVDPPRLMGNQLLAPGHVHLGGDFACLDVRIEFSPEMLDTFRVFDRRRAVPAFGILFEEQLEGDIKAY